MAVYLSLMSIMAVLPLGIGFAQEKIISKKNDRD